MFCTKCGKELREGDNFCAHCGNKVRPDLVPEKEERRYSEVVFNPPFKIEAQRKTEEISRGFEAYSQDPKRESVQFDWNLDGFPGTTKKKDDDFKFNWDDVLERKRDSRQIEVEKILFTAPVEKKEEVAKVEEAAKPSVVTTLTEEIEEIAEEPKDLFAELDTREKKPLSIEALEKELFGEVPAVEGVEVIAEADEVQDEMAKTRLYEAPKDKFYTYNAKKDAFQELLDKERERVLKLEEERKAQWRDFTLTEDQMEKKPNEALSFEEVFREPKIFTGDILKEVAVVLPPLTPVVMAYEEEAAEAPAMETAEVIAEAVEEAKTEVKTDAVAEEVLPFHEESLTTKEKTKLRFSDVFPREDFDVDGGGDGDSDASGEEEKELKEEEKTIETEVKEEATEEAVVEETTEKATEEDSKESEEDYEEKPKKNILLKIIIGLLTILIIAEGFFIGVRLIAPDSDLSYKVDGLVAKITAIFTGEGDDIETIVKNLSQNVASIGELKVDDSLKYDLSKAKTFKELAQTTPFENSDWIQNSDGTAITYGQGIIEGLITYYDQLGINGKLKDGLKGINKLEIGEIRTGGDGFYVLSKVTYKGEDGEVVKYETAYLKSGSQLINVKEVKEETL